MGLRMVTAIVRTGKVREVEKRLASLGITGLTVTRVKGFGEFREPLRPDAEVEHARIEVYALESSVRDIVAAVMEAAWTGLAGDGIVAVLPVEVLYRVRDKHEALPHPG